MQTSATTQRTIAGKLYRAQFVINTAIDNPEIAELLSGYGYSMERLRAGRALYDTAQEWHQRQKAEQTGKQQARGTTSAALKQAQERHKSIRKLARIALRGHPTFKAALALYGPRIATITGWSDQARLFYANALSVPGVMERLEQFNITRETLEEGLAEINTLETLRRNQKSEQGDASTSTARRNTALATLTRWVDDLVTVAEIALAARPDLLVKFTVR